MSATRTAGSRRASRWQRWLRVLAAVLTIAFAVPPGYAAWNYVRWQNEMIAWDHGTIERLCGGDTEEDRLLDIQFVKQWEYKALKKTSDGKEVWLHWKLSKRHCGNWMLIGPPEAGTLIRPFNERFPNGAPNRQTVNCIGQPIDETDYWIRRDQMFRVDS